MVILNLSGIPFHAVVVLGPEYDFLSKSTSTYCEMTTLQTLKVSKFQNEFMKSLFLPNHEPKILRISVL